MNLNSGEELARAKQIVERFVRRFQPSYKLLAYHAALPLVLTPELLNFLRVQFLRSEVPWVAEVDLLLSDLCRQVGYELYAMDTAIRAYLLEEMKRELGAGRMQEIARLLISYVKHLHQKNPYITSKELQAQQWAAMVYIEPETAVREIASEFNGLVNQAELARLSKITQELAPQLSEYQELLNYATLVSQVLKDAKQVNHQQLNRTYEVLSGLELHLPNKLLPQIQIDTSQKAQTLKSINSTMMQYFHWYIPNDGKLWDEVNNKAQELANAGFNAVWLPPAYKGMSGTYDVGYAVYDMYDLGEFEQKGSVLTKYGDRQQYLNAVKSLQSSGIQVYADTVLNHRIGGDDTEIAKATPFNRRDRLNPKDGMRDIKCYTHYNFPGRKGKYSQFEWHWWHFDAVDYDEYTQDSNTIYLLEGKVFDDYVALENGNFSYLMGCDCDFQSKEVQDEAINWGKWYLDATGVDGFRLDAIKHISSWFFPIWISEMERHAGKDLFVVGEYWHNDISTVHWYIDAVQSKMSVFDVTLHYNFHYASKSGESYDMRRILDNTLMQQRPTHAVTFVENHDSQPLQALESPVEPWFKPLAYALILLREEGYPCVFYADYYGAEYEDYDRDGNLCPIYLPSLKFLIDKFLYARQNFAYGYQYNYFDHWDIIGWTRLGNPKHPQAMAVIMSNGTGGSKWMEVGKPNIKFYDLTEHVKEPISTNEQGWGEFCCNGSSVSVWIEQEINQI